jgi:hypothetical protein
MRTRVLSIGAAVLSLAASVAGAETLTERLQQTRMTVLRTDRQAGTFMCAEHRRWMSVSKADLSKVHEGDIVNVEKRNGRPARLMVVRSASDELASPEQ